MPIRLKTVIIDLNIAKDTAVEFLAKKGHKIESDLNTKISDEQHLLLVQGFDKDMTAKLEAERISQARLERDKIDAVALAGYLNVNKEPKKETKPAAKPETKPDIKTETKETKPEAKLEPKTEKTTEPKAEIKSDPAPEAKEEKTTASKAENKPVEMPTESVSEAEPKSIGLKEVGFIDLKTQEDLFRERKRRRDRERKKRRRAAEKERKILARQQQETSANPTENKEKKSTEQQLPLEKDTKLIEKPQEQIKEEKKEPEIFRYTKAKLDAAPVVVGTIDLDSINQSMRPKAKSKKQKIREREERLRKEAEARREQSKQAKLTTATTGSGDKTTDGDKPKKPRERFKTSKVDINKVAAEGKAGKSKKPFRKEVNEEEVQKQVKETLARLQNGNRQFGKGAKHRREKRANVQERLQEEMQIAEGEKNTLKLTEFVTANELAVMMNIPVTKVIAVCMSIGMMVSINQRLDAETINIVAEEFGYKTEFVSQDVVEAIAEEEDRPEDLVPRAPVVTVMGHVDHGKTSLLDYIRKTNVIAGEAGGITQHIGAYNVELENGQQITFLDTPGHEAFTAMRARGAKVTDIAIIIVAADDSIMPQTIEAINHASAAGVPIVFAINKIDKDGANPEKIKEALANMNYLVEDWGGKYQSQDISAKKGIGVAELLEKVLLEAELLELKANPNKKAVGSIIESSLDKGRGYISTVLVQNGTLRQGDIVIAGTYYGKVKAMFDERNQRQKQVLPAEPVLILGLNGAPQAGDTFNVMETEQEAREITNRREQLQREQNLRTRKHFTLDELGRRIALGDFKELNVIVKGDVDGSVEALSDSLLKLSTEHIQVNVIHKAVGAISDADVMLAAASNAIVIGFQVRPTASARRAAENEQIDLRLYSVIYDAIEEIKSAMEGMLAPEIKEEITATLEVLETFKITKVGTVAGCIVREGKVHRIDKVRIIRDGIVVHTGELESLKRLKDDVKEVGTNFECGLNIKNYNDVQTGDLIEAYTETEIKAKL